MSKMLTLSFENEDYGTCTLLPKINDDTKTWDYIISSQDLQLGETRLIWNTSLDVEILISILHTIKVQTVVSNVVDILVELAFKFSDVEQIIINSSKDMDNQFATLEKKGFIKTDEQSRYILTRYDHALLQLSNLISSENLAPNLANLVEDLANRASDLWFKYFKQANTLLSVGGVGESIVQLSSVELNDLSFTGYSDSNSPKFTNNEIIQFLREENLISKKIDSNNLSTVFSLGSHEGFTRLARCIYHPSENDGMFFPSGSYGLLAVGIADTKPFNYKINLVPVDKANKEKINLVNLADLVKKYPTTRSLFIDLKTTLGSVYSTNEIKDIMLFCKKHHLFLIVDAAHLNMQLQDNITFPDVHLLANENAFYEFAIMYTGSKTYGLERARIGYIILDKRSLLISAEKMDMNLFHLQGTNPKIPSCIARKLIDTPLLKRQEFLKSQREVHRFNMNLMIAYIEGINSINIDDDLKTKISLEIPSKYHRGIGAIKMIYKPDVGIQMKVNAAGFCTKYLANIRLFNAEILCYALILFARVITLHAYQILDSEGLAIRLSFTNKDDVHKGMQNISRFYDLLTDHPIHNRFMSDVAVDKIIESNEENKALYTLTSMIKTEKLNLNPNLTDLANDLTKRVVPIWYEYVSRGVLLSTGGVERSFSLATANVASSLNLQTFNGYRSDRGSVFIKQDDMKKLLQNDVMIGSKTDVTQLLASFCSGSHEGIMRIMRCIYDADKNNGIFFPKSSYGLLANALNNQAALKHGIILLDINENNGEKIDIHGFRQAASLNPSFKTLILELKTMCGAVYSAEELGEIILICKEYDIFLIADAAHWNMEFSAKHKFADVSGICQRHNYHEFAAIYTGSKTYGLEGARIGIMLFSHQMQATTQKIIDYNFYRVHGAGGDLSFEIMEQLIKSSPQERQIFFRETAEIHRFNMNVMIAYIEGVNSTNIDEDLKAQITSAIAEKYHDGNSELKLVYKPEAGIHLKIDMSQLKNKYLFNIKMFNAELFSYGLNLFQKVVTLHSYCILDPKGSTMRLSFSSINDVHEGMKRLYEFTRFLTNQPRANKYWPGEIIDETKILTIHQKKNTVISSQSNLFFSKRIKLSNNSLTQLTPITYFGQRENIVHDLFALFGDKKYQCLYDPFAGSGSISFAAMNAQIAKFYFINDSFELLSRLWILIREYPEFFISKYSEYVHKYCSISKEERFEFYTQLLEKYNANYHSHIYADAAIDFVFLINFSDTKIPVFDENQTLWLKPDVFIDVMHETQEITIFSQRVNDLKQLLKLNSIKFTSGNFSTALQDVSTGDLVILDPPYPNQANNVYIKLQSEEELYLSLQNTMAELQSKNVDFIMLYGARNIPLTRQFNKQVGLQHLIRLNEHKVYGTFIDHIYVSSGLVIEKEQLPLGMAFYHEYCSLEEAMSDAIYNNVLKSLYENKYQTDECSQGKRLRNNF